MTLMSAIVAYFLAPLIVVQSGAENLFIVFAFPSLIPVLTLLFVWAVFEESCKIPPWLIGLLLVDLSLAIWRATHGYNFVESEVIAQLLKVFAATYAIYIVWRGRENDLVEVRLKVRLVFIGALTVTVLGISVNEILRIYNVELPGSILANLWMLSLALFGNLAFIKMNPTLQLVGDPKQIVLAEKDVSDPIIDELLVRMRDERLYADHDLRVASLADIVGIPEYQLRQKINQSLGYRNFNQFVNRYRIEEAGQRLIQDARTPVLSIALDVGFRSISSFNTAFQGQFGVSPTKYRAQALSNS